MKKTYLILCILGGWNIGLSLQGQNCVITSGTHLIEGGGSISYSVGQLIVSRLSNESYTLFHGIQHPFTDFFTDSKIDENQMMQTDNKFGIKIFSDPLKSQGIIKLEVFQENLSYAVYTVNGMLIRKKEIVANETYVPLVSGLYVFTVMENNRVLHRSQIIKL